MISPKNSTIPLSINASHASILAPPSSPNNTNNILYQPVAIFNNSASLADAERNLYRNSLVESPIMTNSPLQSSTFAELQDTLAQFANVFGSQQDLTQSMDLSTLPPALNFLSQESLSDIETQQTVEEQERNIYFMQAALRMTHETVAFEILPEEEVEFLIREEKKLQARVKGLEESYNREKKYCEAARSLVQLHKGKKHVEKKSLRELSISQEKTNQYLEKLRDYSDELSRINAKLSNHRAAVLRQGFQEMSLSNQKLEKLRDNQRKSVLALGKLNMLVNDTKTTDNVLNKSEVTTATTTDPASAANSTLNAQIINLEFAVRELTRENEKNRLELKALQTFTENENTKHESTQSKLTQLESLIETITQDTINEAKDTESPFFKLSSLKDLIQGYRNRISDLEQALMKAESAVASPTMENFALYPHNRSKSLFSLVGNISNANNPKPADEPCDGHLSPVANVFNIHPLRRVPSNASCISSVSNNETVKAFELLSMKESECNDLRKRLSKAYHERSLTALEHSKMLQVIEELLILNSQNPTDPNMLKMKQETVVALLKKIRATLIPLTEFQAFDPLELYSDPCFSPFDSDSPATPNEQQLVSVNSTGDSAAAHLRHFRSNSAFSSKASLNLSDEANATATIPRTPESNRVIRKRTDSPLSLSINTKQSFTNVPISLIERRPFTPNTEIKTEGKPSDNPCETPTSPHRIMVSPISPSSRKIGHNKSNSVKLRRETLVCSMKLQLEQTGPQPLNPPPPMPPPTLPLHARTASEMFSPTLQNTEIPSEVNATVVAPAAAAAGKDKSKWVKMLNSLGGNGKS